MRPLSRCNPLTLVRQCGNSPSDCVRARDGRLLRVTENRDRQLVSVLLSSDDPWFLGGPAVCGVSVSYRFIFFFLRL